MTDEHPIEAVRTEPIRVLFVAAGCSMQDYIGHPELVAWYEGVLSEYCGSRVQVALAFGDADGRMRELMDKQEVVLNPRITYFPLDANLSLGAVGQEWCHARLALLDVIDRFKPDAIQCLGSEWPYGAIAEDVNIPVVIHMMGFLNIYYPSIDMATGYSHGQSHPARRWLRFWRSRPKPVVDVTRVRSKENAEFERRVMRANRYFMGRTDWDRNIVRYYAPGSQYFQVSECIKHPFIRHAGSWRYHFGEKLRLLTVSAADDRKGNTVILQTAKVLKEIVGIDFEWRVAGNTDQFDRFERQSGIRAADVNVRLLDMLAPEEVVGELKEADFFIHLSIIDNSPRSICEAQLVGCPVIASQVGGVPQLVEDGKTGYLYPYNEPHTLAFLIANLYGQCEELTKVSETATRVSLERNDPKRIAERIYAIYKEVLADHG